MRYFIFFLFLGTSLISYSMQVRKEFKSYLLAKAVENNQEHAASLLLQDGASPDVTVTIKLNGQERPSLLEFARIFEFNEMVRLLKRHRAYDAQDHVSELCAWMGVPDPYKYN